jgi:hypothetical protein
LGAAASYMLLISAFVLTLAPICACEHALEESFVKQGNNKKPFTRRFCIGLQIEPITILNSVVQGVYWKVYSY